MLLIPGLISLRILWHEKPIVKSAYKYIVSDYLVYSFLIKLLVYGFMFISYSQRTVSFSINMPAISHILSASFVFKYLIVSLTSAVGLAITIPKLIRLYEKHKHRYRLINLRFAKKIKIPKRLKVLIFIIIAIAAAYYIPRVYASSYAPQILALTPLEVKQGQNILEEYELKGQDIEITIAGTSITLDTIVYVNNLRVDHVWEITRDDESEHYEAEYDVFDSELDGFDSGLRFRLPNILLLEPGEVNIVAVNNADAIIPARSNGVSLRVREVEYPEITSIMVTQLTDMIVKLHIYGEKFVPDASVLINYVPHNATIIYDEQNIHVYLDGTNLPLIQPLSYEGDEYSNESQDEIAIVVQNSEGVASTEYILTGLPRFDTTASITNCADWLGADTNLIAAALGGWDGLTNTNSREAFLHNYEQGFRAFVFGTQFSADGILFGICAAMRTPLFTFWQEQELAPYTLMPFEEIVELMLEYDDWYLITDTKYHNNMQALQSSFEYMLDAVNNADPNLLNRIIVQVYNQRMYYFMISNFPFSAYIYNIYASADSNEEVLEFVEKAGMAVVAMPITRATPEFLEALNGLGVASLVHSTNYLREIRNLFEMGVIGVYTHFAIPNMMHRILRISEEELDRRELILIEEQNHREFIKFVNELQEDIDEDYIRIISPGNMAEVLEDNEDAFLVSVSDDVGEALLALISLESYPISYVINDGYLFIDGYKYNHIIDKEAITFITYNKAIRRVTQAITFEPQNYFMRTDYDFQLENNRRYFMEYLDNLLHEDFMILLSVRDDASEALDVGMLDKLASLGLVESLQDQVKYSYIAIINGDTVVFENLSDERIDYVDFFDRWLIEVTSAGWLVGDNSSIRVDGVEHSRNERGINIVVFNRRTGMIEDSVVFDTHYGIHAHR